MTLSIRKMYFLGFAFIALLLGGTFYLQVYAGFNPCALCILQRLVFALLGLLFFIGIWVKHRWGQITIGSLAILSSLLGAFLSGRQVWLQLQPASANAECGVSLEYLFKVLPMDQALKHILTGSAECSQTGWQFLHISLAGWSLVGFMFFIVFAVLQTIRAYKQCVSK